MRRLTTDEFVSRARTIHGEAFDYSLVEYKSTNSPVKIICPIHGIFEKSPSNHLHKTRPQGCPECADELRGERRKLSESEVINRILSVHGDRYDLSNVTYSGMRDKVLLLCSIHGEFEITPMKLIYDRQGCKKCGFESRAKKKSIAREGESVADLFPEIGRELHESNSIKASELKSGSNQRLLWECTVCSHQWLATVNHRTSGTGCPVCTRGDLHSSGTNSMAKTHPHLAEELLPNPHGDAHDLVAGTNRLLPWECKDCGHRWSTSGNNRASGKGCSVCAKYGFDRTKPAQYYVHEIIRPGSTSIFKAGISNDWRQRKSRIKSGLLQGMALRTVEILEFELGSEAESLESILLSIDEIRHGPLPIDGGTELFTANPLDYARMAGLID